MAHAPKYKIYSASGEYRASVKDATDAAVLVSIGYPDGGTVRLGPCPILFTATPDSSNSYDAIAQEIYARESQVQRASFRHAYGRDA